MKFRKIMLVTLLLLAVLTIGAASAAEVADGTGNETVIESPADYVIGTSEGNDDLSVNPKDFNVTFLADEVDIKDENAKVLRFYWPDDVGSYDFVTVEVENGSAPWYQKGAGATFQDVTFAELYIFDPGDYKITVKYNYDTFIAESTLKVTKTYSPNDFIELYSKSITDPTDYVCNVFDSNDIGLNGQVTVLANGTSVYNNTFTGNGNTAVRINGKDLAGDLKGSYNIRVVYKRATNGKEYYKDAIISFGSSEPVIPDTKPKITFSPSAQDSTYGQDAVVKVTAYDVYRVVNDTISANVLVSALYFDGIKYITVASSNATLTNGVGSARLSGLNVAEYLIFIEANDTDAYKANVYSTTLTVNKAQSKILFDDAVVELGSGAPYNLTVDFEKASGITAKVDGENVTVDGNVVLIPALSEGTHTLVISTIPDDNHIEDAKEVTLNVTKPRSSIIIDSPINLVKGSSVDVTVTVKDALGFNASIEGHPEALRINGNVITISGLDVGTYALTVSTIVDENHLSVTEKATVKVKMLESDIIFSNDTITFDYGSSGSIIATVINGTIAKAIVIAHPEAIISINGSKITVSNLDAGSYTLSVTTKPIPGYAAKIKSVEVIVNPVSEVKVNSSINVEDVELDYGSSKNVVVETVGAIGFTAKIDGKDAVVEGDAVVVSGLDAGTHILTITTVPDSGHLEVTKNATITVNKIKTYLISDAVVTVYNGGKYLTATLKDASGKKISGVKVTVVLGGKTYTQTTDNGQIKVSTNGLAPVKTYGAKITFNTNSKYAKSTKTVSVKVTKATPKLTAKAKTFKKSLKTKKYAVSLKTNQNKVMKNTKITLKVNGKTYSATTNSKGQATFKITKLTKKGGFTATIKYAGSKYYNAKTVKAKIVVK